VALALLAGAVAASPVAARVFTGTGKGDRVLGTGGADFIRLGAGNDRAHGGGGGDNISGGAGRDRLTGGAGTDSLSGGDGRDHLIGGRGKDRLRGGGGSDTLNAADGRADAKVDGGGGRNVCRVDAVDVAVTRNCSKLTVVAGRGTQGGGGGAPATQPPVRESGLLDLLQPPSLSCPASLPACPFDLTGTGAEGLTGLPGLPGLPALPGAPGVPGADGLLGTITGGGGVTVPGVGTILTITGDVWTATGVLSCTSDGFLRVTIGTQTLDVPVSCTG
jgi:Ca2+-binding RTX toxin-like protein